MFQKHLAPKFDIASGEAFRINGMEEQLMRDLVEQLQHNPITPTSCIKTLSHTNEYCHNLITPHVTAPSRILLSTLSHVILVSVVLHLGITLDSRMENGRSVPLKLLVISHNGCLPAIDISL